MQTLRVIGGTDFSMIFDIADAALVSLNDYYAALANEYGNVYYVDAPDAAIFYPEGTHLIDIVKDIKGFLYGVHPNHEGHAYIAGRVLDALRDLNDECRALLIDAVYGDLTAHDVDELLYDREAQACSFDVLGGCLINSLKCREEVRDVF